MAEGLQNYWAIYVVMRASAQLDPQIYFDYPVEAAMVS